MGEGAKDCWEEEGVAKVTETGLDRLIHNTNSVVILYSI